MDGEPAGAVAVVDTVTNTVTATIPIGSQPGDVVVAPDGNRAYISNRQARTVEVVDL